MEIRGLGILNISNLLGAVKVKDSAFLTCIGELSLETLENRAEPAKMFKDILGIFTPCFSLPYSPGRDMPLLVETMARISL
jgi:HPr kinase/phosphorylase